MTKSNDTTVDDAVARYVYEHAIEHADVDAPTADDRRRQRGGYVFDEDSWDYPRWSDVDDVELIESFGYGMDSRHGRHHSEDDSPFLVFHGSIEGRETRQVSSATYNPPRKAHPAEYDHQRIELWFTLSVALTEPFSSVPLLTIERI